jgi:hypothetical protein
MVECAIASSNAINTLNGEDGGVRELTCLPGVMTSGGALSLANLAIVRLGAD